MSNNNNGATMIEETNEAYHQRDEISASDLKLYWSSPRKYEATKILGTMEREETAAMRFGTAVHAAILQPDEFRKRYAICPADCSDKRTTKYKEWAKAVGLPAIVLTAKEGFGIESIVDNAKRHPIAGKILEATTEAEKSVLWDEDGIACRMRFDGIAGRVIFDVKTVANLEGFDRQCFDLGYHLQAAHYLAGIQSIRPEVTTFLFIAVETAAPYRVRVKQFDDDAMQVGIDERLAVLRRLAEAKLSGIFADPGEDEIGAITVPRYFTRRMTE